MKWALAVVIAVTVWTVLGGVGAASPASVGENPACENPSQGFTHSVAGSDGTSLERAGPGIVTSRTRIGCERLQPS